MSKRVLIYCRTSGDDSERDSLTYQENECRTFADKQGYQVIEALREDVKGVSGSDFFAPKMQEVVSYAKRGLIDVVLCRDTKRFARDRVKADFFEYELKRHGVALEFCWEKFSDNSDGNFQKGIAYLIAQKSKDDITQGLQTGKKNRVRYEHSMITSPGNVLFGYTTERIGKAFVAKIVESEASIIRLIFTWYTEDNLSIGEIVRRLNDEKIPTYTTLRGATRFKNKSSRWYQSYISKILRNEAYAGTWYYGKRNVIRRHNEQGEKVSKIIRNDKSNFIKVEIPPIVSRETWQKAQNRLDNNKAFGRGTKPKYQHLLSKRFTCHCGLSMVASTQGGDKYTIYLCNVRSRKDGFNRTCHQKAIKSKHVDALAWDWLEEILKDKEKLQSRIDAYLERKDKELQPILSKIKTLDEFIAKRKQEYDNLVELYISSTDYGKKQLSSKKIEREEQLKDLEAQREEASEKLIKFEENVSMLRRYKEAYERHVSSGNDTEFFYLFLGQKFDYVTADNLLQDNKPLTFEDKLKLVERFDLRASLVKDDGGNVLLHLTCNLGETLSELSSSNHASGQLPETFSLILSDTLTLDFTSLPQFQESQVSATI